MDQDTFEREAVAVRGPAVAMAEDAGFSTDLFAIDPAKLGAARMEIKNPVTKKGTGQYIWLLPHEATKVQAFLHSEADSEFARDAERAANGAEPKGRTVKEGIERAVQLLIVATERWENVTFGGSAKDFTIANARTLYHVDYVRAQAVTFMKNLDNFTQG